MLYKNAESCSCPIPVTVEQVGKVTIVRLTDNVQAVDIQDEHPQTIYRYDEVDFKLPEGRKETVESISSNFAEWWSYGSTNTEEEVTLEDRVSALEDMYLMTMMEG